jgi:hypothetical protein
MTQMGLLYDDTSELNGSDEAAAAAAVTVVEPTQQQQQQQQQQETAVEHTDAIASSTNCSDVSQADVTDNVASNVAAVPAVVPAAPAPAAVSDAQLLQLWMKAPALADNCISVIQHDQPDCAERVQAFLDTEQMRAKQCANSSDAVNAELMLYAREQLRAAAQYCESNGQSDETSVLQGWQKLLSLSAQIACSIEQQVRAYTCNYYFSTKFLLLLSLLVLKYSNCYYFSSTAAGSSTCASSIAYLCSMCVVVVQRTAQSCHKAVSEYAHTL